MSFHRASRRHDTPLLLGGSSDRDAGGFLVAELSRNLRICIGEKVRKVDRVRHKYGEWWLAFEDRIGYGALDGNDADQIRAALGPVSGFDKVILVNPFDPASGVASLSPNGLFGGPTSTCQPTAAGVTMAAAAEAVR